MINPGHRYILGNLPPPVGGVSTFMRRHLSRLRASGEQFEARDWVKMSAVERVRWILFLALFPRRLQLEFNAYETWAMGAVVLRPFRTHLTLRIHSGGPESRLSPGRQWIFRRFLGRVDHLILVGPHVRDVLARAGFELPCEPEIQPAFLPPPPEDEPAILQTYGDRGLSFLESHSPLLVLQGSDTFHDGVDLYGTDLALDVLADLRRTHPRAGLVVGSPSRGDAAFQAYCLGLDDRMAAEGIQDAVWILDGERELWPLIKRASVFLRPTTSDGDSIGVREALHFGVPVVASDVVPRPDGVRLFASRDSEDLIRAVRAALGATGAEGAGASHPVPQQSHRPR
ncbi:MAG: glycosyltransferase family 4 protein [Rhodothermales bacterium]|nr:glycosyltransferase family 4 protein [Rhodothermales bacterium]